ncbi:Chromosome segregation ATPase [Giardia muris]|uniref:Structural maintenance of chromosomes protein n=1 Tax=Giardia muris TaxID=5742 RepID=A0A4Z1SYL2_GIAMU|nr:Chromosome segregation ATPase [Giardia muris]|eukprot:TNJ29865.1 Chromosome segregation ATPase [Giardia muris]
MHISEIILDGFKSYATQVRVGPFDRSFSAITGLNGSGKSNILDGICFVLGISMLTRVRVTTLTELIYKQGQAGVTRASVTLVFDNRDRQRSPPGYEDYSLLEVTRQVFKNGTTKYLLNGMTAKLKTVKQLFRSVGLSIDNPTFLVMQGRITTILNMRPQEVLSLLEECTGTLVYESNRQEAMRTFEQKEAKLQGIAQTLQEDILPRLRKLEEERNAVAELGRVERVLEILGIIIGAISLYTSFEMLRRARERQEQAQRALQREAQTRRQLDTEKAQTQEALAHVRAQLATAVDSTERRALSERFSQLESNYLSFQGKGRLLKEQQDDLFKQLHQREGRQKALSSRIADLRTRLATIERSSDLVRLQRTIENLQAEITTTEASLLLAAKGNLSRDELTSQCSYLTLKSVLQGSMDGVLEELVTGLLRQIPGSDVYLAPISDIILTFLHEGMTSGAIILHATTKSLSGVVEEAIEAIFRARGDPQYLTPLEISFGLKKYESDSLRAAEHTFGEIVSLYARLDHAAQEELSRAKESDNVGFTALQTILDEAFGLLRKVQNCARDLQAIYPTLDEYIEQQRNLEVRVYGEDLTAILTFLDEILSVPHGDALQSLYVKTQGYLSFLAQENASELAVTGFGTTSAINNQDSSISTEGFNYLDNLDSALRAVSKRITTYISLLGRSLSTLRGHASAFSCTTTAGQQQTAAIRSIIVEAGRAGVRNSAQVIQMLMGIDGKVRVQHDLIGPILAFLQLNEEVILGLGSNRLQLVRVLELASASKLMHIAFMTATAAAGFVRSSHCTTRITAVPLDTVRVTRITADMRERVRARGGVFAADCFISINDTILDYTFGTTVICETLDDANRIAYDRQLGYKCITLDGDIVDASGSISGGSRSFDMSTSASVFDVMQEYRDRVGMAPFLTSVSGGLSYVSPNPDAERLFTSFANKDSMFGTAEKLVDRLTAIVGSLRGALTQYDSATTRLSAALSDRKISHVTVGSEVAAFLARAHTEYLLLPAQLTVFRSTVKTRKTIQSLSLNAALQVTEILVARRLLTHVTPLTKSISVDDPIAVRKHLTELQTMLQQSEQEQNNFYRENDVSTLEAELATSVDELQVVVTHIQETQRHLEGLRNRALAMNATLAEAAAQLDEHRARCEAQDAHVTRLTEQCAEQEAALRDVEERFRSVDRSIEQATEESLQAQGTLSEVAHQVEADTALRIHFLLLSIVTGPNTLLTNIPNDCISRNALHTLTNLVSTAFDAQGRPIDEEFRASYEAMAGTLAASSIVSSFLTNARVSTQESMDMLHLLMYGGCVERGLPVESRIDAIDLEALVKYVRQEHAHLRLHAGTSTIVPNAYEELRRNASELQKMHDQILTDKAKILSLISQIDSQKLESLHASHQQVNRDLDATFGMLLPGASAQLQMVDSRDITKGLTFNVRLENTHTTLSGLSGGQRSLLALSLIFSLLLYKPCPIYILDEIDAALDLSHTQHIGALIRTKFPQSQFLVVSLKDGLFSNANVLFRVRFVGGSSLVERHSIG